MSGILYVVPTPIGNMGDISPRSKNILCECDFVAAEDTRVGGKLLMLLDIKKPLVSFHQYTGAEKTSSIVDRILSGEKCALITDAGTPAISDPGERLVAECAAKGITVIPLPGPCAAVTALSASGLNSRRFCFEGFLPDEKTDEYLDELKTETRTMIFYAAPHDLMKVIAKLENAFGNRRCVLAKEITKINECFLRTTLPMLADEVVSRGESFKKGEFVLIVEGMQQADRFWESMDIKEHLLHYIALGLSKMDACKQVARDRRLSKGVIYKVAAELEELKNHE